MKQTKELSKENILNLQKPVFFKMKSFDLDLQFKTLLGGF